MSEIKIMLVEDDSITAYSISKMLESLNYSVSDIFASGEQALKQIAANKPDLILMDIVLEGAMDGIEAATYIKENLDIPVVYITSSSDRDTLERAKKSEPYGYIIKPISISELYSTIETVLYRHRLSQKLKHSESLYRTLVETISQGIVEYNREGIVTFCNESFSAMTGYQKEEIIGKSFDSFILNRDIKFTFDLSEGMTSGPGRSYTRYYDVINNAQGKHIDVQIDWDFKHEESGEFTGIIAVITNITERKYSEILREIEHDAAIYLSTAPEINDALEKVTEILSLLPDIKASCLYYKKNSIQKMALGACVNIMNEIKNRIKEFMPGSDEYDLLIGDKTSQYEGSSLPGALKQLSDEPAHNSAVLVPIISEKYYQASLLCVFHQKNGISPALQNTLETIAAHTGSVIKRMTVEEALKKSEARYRRLIETMNDGIFILNQDNTISYANDKFCKLLGFSIEEISGAPVTGFMDNLNKRIFLMVMGSGYVAEYRSIDMEWINKSGSVVYSILSPQIMKESETGREERFAVVTDITEHKKMEQELIKIQKLESLSLLAGGIAHDYNNILTGILGNINLAKINFEPESDIYGILDEAEQASLKARDISQQLLTFSKGGDPVKKPVNIRDILYGSASFSLRGSNVKSEFFIADDLWIVDVDEAQFSQVIDNIIINAMQAMPRGGTVKVFAENAVVSTIDSLPLREGKYVKVSIKDHGMGIPEEYSEKIFDLFFTTKQKGNGIGLATSFSIIKKHSGHLSYESIPGKGTTFHVYLPASGSELNTKKTVSLKRSPEKHGRILVMDDEEIIRKIVQKMLTKIGYAVDTAHEGNEAIEMYRKAAGNNKKYDMVLMDLTVPGGMGGREATEKILEIDPAAIIVASSGYANDPIRINYMQYGFKNFLPKPFKIDELVSIINSSMLEV
ncbi:MAG TPA: response regulator [Spirochaetota bacterium]|nr:response regulator [Spirochaetota bacterium]HPI89508.1 response regulator [Spirochaetota bacterium]HPR47096.1 response regulator [Spirochaetota bacterium]